MTTHRNAMLMLVLCSACSGSTVRMVGSQYVKTGTFGPNGGTLTVLPSDDAALQGTQVIIPPGALSAQTPIQIGVTNQAVVSSGALGPIIDFEPTGTVRLLRAGDRHHPGDPQWARSLARWRHGRRIRRNLA